MTAPLSECALATVRLSIESALRDAVATGWVPRRFPRLTNREVCAVMAPVARGVAVSFVACHTWLGLDNCQAKALVAGFDGLGRCSADDPRLYDMGRELATKWVAP